MLTLLIKLLIGVNNDRTLGIREAVRGTRFHLGTSRKSAHVVVGSEQCLDSGGSAHSAGPAAYEIAMWCSLF
jgi:hypothetical protein